MPKGKLLISQEQVQPIKDKKTKMIEKVKKKQKSLSLQDNFDESESGNKVEQEVKIEIQERKNQKLKHLAICFPDSILEIPQTSALRAYFISEIARIASIFKVDQIIILKDHAYQPKSQNFVPSQYIARNLQYLETPQYLRKHLFKMHPDLGNVGLMNPIESRHHLKSDEVSEFRQGVVLQRPTKSGSGSWVEIGLKKQAKIDVLLLPLTRVTLRLNNYQDPQAPFYDGQAVSRRTPRQQANLYWGYEVRMAKNLKQILSEREYDEVVLCNHSNESYGLPQVTSFSGTDLREKSMVLIFAGTSDLNVFVEKDERSKWNMKQVLQRFTFAIKTQGLGVKQLRLEEQLFLTLSKLINYTL